LLLADSLACTFVACPCSGDHKEANYQLLFKLRKKVMELRDLVCIQECEIINLRKSMKFVKVSELMSEIDYLRHRLLCQEQEVVTVPATPPEP